MKKILIVFALINVAAGYCLHQQPPALPLGQAADGTWIYPQSSGSDDGHLLAVALQAFVFTLFMSLFSRRLTMAAYALNLLVLWLVCALIALDSSLWAAAQAGYAWPLLAVAAAHLPLLRPLFRQPERRQQC